MLKKCTQIIPNLTSGTPNGEFPVSSFLFYILCSVIFFFFFLSKANELFALNGNLRHNILCRIKRSPVWQCLFVSPPPLYTRLNADVVNSYFWRQTIRPVRVRVHATVLGIFFFFFYTIFLVMTPIGV